MNRRRLLSGAAGIVVGACVPLWPWRLLSAAQADVPRGMIDVHAHMVPGFYRDAALAAGVDHPDGMPNGYPEWTPESAIEAMDRLGIETAILSVSSPGINFGNDRAAVDLARRVNDYAASLKSARPERFGFFASVPMPDVTSSLAEVTRALDVLGADGVILTSNSGGFYPGDEIFEPLLAELDRREAVVFIHPTSPKSSCCSTGHQELPAPVVEFMFETTRMVITLVLTGAIFRYRKIRYIIPHAGATLPALADRIAPLPNSIAPSPKLLSGETLGREDFFAILRRFYYDLAGAPVPRALTGLRTFAAPDRILYGSDRPWTDDRAVAYRHTQLDEELSAEPAFARAVYRDNALALFPRLQKILGKPAAAGR